MSTPETNLLPCPFCGNDNCAKLQQDKVAYLSPFDWIVGCLICGACSSNKETKEKAIKAWNTRTVPSQPSFDVIEQRQQAMKDSTKISGDDMKLMVGSAQPPSHPFAKAFFW